MMALEPVNTGLAQGQPVGGPENYLHDHCGKVHMLFLNSYSLFCHNKGYIFQSHLKQV